MSLSQLYVLIPYILSALICAAVGVYSLKRMPIPGALAFAVLAFFEAEWTLGYILQDLSPGLIGKLFWNNVQFLGAVGAPLAYYNFSLAYRELRRGSTG